MRLMHHSAVMLGGWLPGTHWAFTVETASQPTLVVTAPALSDSDVTWQRPNGSTFTGKAPAATQFNRTGTYRLYLSDWSAMTYFAREAGDISGDISLWDVPSGLQVLTLDTSSVNYGTGGMFANWSTALERVNLAYTSATTAEIDRMLHDCVASGKTSKALWINGNAAPSSTAPGSDYDILVNSRTWLLAPT